MEGFEVIGLRLDLVIVGWLAGGSIALATVLFCVASVVRKKVGGYKPEFIFMLFGTIVSVFGGLLALAFIALLIPFKSVYHHWYGTSGEVVSVTNIFEGGSGEISPGYVVELDSVDKPLLFDDPRILKTDGEINVSCSVEWVPAGVDRLNCWIAK